MKKLKVLVASAALTLGNCAFEARCDDWILSPASPASPLSPANPANPASPLSPANPANPASPLNFTNLDDINYSERSEKILKYGLIGISLATVGVLGYYFFSRGPFM
jgi:hypothetical protein